MKEIMEVREFITREIDIDVVDDVCESLYIAFCGPQGLTEAGANHFEDALDLKIEVDKDACTAVVLIDGPAGRPSSEQRRSSFSALPGIARRTITIAGLRMKLTIDQVQALEIGSTVLLERETPAGPLCIECTVARRGGGEKFLTYRIEGVLRALAIREYKRTAYRK